MEILKYPNQKDWDDILTRPTFDDSALNQIVQGVLDDIKQRGDIAVLEYGSKFDKAEITLDTIKVVSQEFSASEKQISSDLKLAIQRAARNIETFHLSQQRDYPKVVTSLGVTCWQKAVGIEKVGLYVPGGTAPLFSTVLMLAIPAKIAGCKEIVLCTPPDKDGNINPAILYAAHLAGVDAVFKIGGIQAIGAMTYGTGTVPKVYKIFGPGNQYVMKAKQLVSVKDVAIDMPAGPSEVLVLADETANPAFVAADLLSQAEHGADSQVVLVATDEALLKSVEEEIGTQLQQLPRKEIAEKALLHSKLILVKDQNEAIELSNRYAPEHLIIQMKNYMSIAERVVNAGSVFLGNYTPESAGDYASGTNHTLPTNGYATAYSGVNLDSFIKKITFQEITQEGVNDLGATIELMAESEQLFAHKNAVTLRRGQ